jgi:alginate O-acetyltransferase complex protein AlgI
MRKMGEDGYSLRLCHSSSTLGGDWRFIFLILISGLIDYFAGLALDKNPNKKRRFLIISLAGNILSLAVFKYSGFFAESIEQFFYYAGSTIELKSRIPAFALIVPVGISFYTFQSMSYTIDIYKGKLKPTKNFFHFFAYLSMFPQLVAGPIVRAKNLLKQLAEKRVVSSLQKWHGLTIDCL